MRSHFPRIPALLGLTFILAACKDNSVTAYRIPKEKEPDMASAAAQAHAGAGVTPGAGAAGADANMANTSVPTTTGAGLAWQAPAHWQTKAGSAMRKATFVITGDAGATAELAVTAFPGDVGGEVANVNRWRGQIQLPTVSEAEVSNAVQRVETNGLKIGYVDMVNTATPPTRVLGAWVPFQGSTWFFKLTGPDALVAREKPAFVAYLQTIKAANP